MKSLWLALLYLLVLPGLVIAAPAVYPVREAIGFADAGLAQKAPAFSRWVATVRIENLGLTFASAFKKEFGSAAVADMTDVTRHKTLVASLHLIRASQYAVPKIDGSTEIHLPLTLSILFTNPDTGEVLYSFTRTSYAAVRTVGTGQNDEQLLNGEIHRNFSALLQGLIEEARKGYDPMQVGAAVVKVWKGLYILDKGTKTGIGRDDSLSDPAGNEIQVCYAAEDYAVATMVLGEPRVGQKFSKYANLALVNQLKKPRVLTMQNGWQDEQLKSISNIFDSELSKESAFTLLPVNESLSTMLKAVARDTSVGQFAMTNQRALPDYMIKFTAAKPRYYELAQTGKFGTLVYEQYLLGELLDKQGRIIYSALGSDRIEDKNVAGMVFDSQARLEILQKNAVTQLAREFSRSLKFARFVLPVSSVEGQRIQVEDQPRQLRGGQSVLVFRGVGKLDGIPGEVWVPIWEATVSEAGAGKAVITPLSEMASGLKDTGISQGDVVLLDAVTVGKASGSDTSVAYCSGISPKLGTVDFDDFPVISRGFGHTLSYSLYDNDADFNAKITQAIKSGGFRDSLNLGKVTTGNRCLQPVHKISFKKNLCEQGLCTHDVSLIVGFRLYAGQEVKGKAGTATTIKTEDCPETCQLSVVQGDLSKNALDLIKDAILKVHYQ
jgi:hypothetical protein